MTWVLGFRRPVGRACAFLTFFLSLLCSPLVRADVAPGGFLESDTTTTVRPLLSSSTISGFLPDRGSFIFPAPYGTQGVRITNSTDCAGQDCVDMIYSYWRNMSNSAGSDTMYIFVGLDRARGGQGPTLFRYTKSTGQLAEVGPLFASSSPYSNNSGEGWYFSYGMPTKIYMQSGSKLLRYDVLSHQMETVFDSTAQYPNTVIHQANSSNDDDVHSATLQNASTYAVMGCIAYKVSTATFYYYPAQGKFDECQIDKSGRYLLIKEKLPQDSCASCDEDNLFVDLQTGQQQVLLDQSGAGGHSDMGYGWYVASDNWNAYANAWRLWDLSEPLTANGVTRQSGVAQGGLVYHNSSWGSFSPSHVSFENATSASISSQYACGGASTATVTPQSNDIICFSLNPAVASEALVVAPVMTNTAATGGTATCPTCVSYGQDPKGNVDPTGQYFFWVSNTDGNRMDAFMVRIPYQLLTGSSGSGGTGGDTVAPTISLTAPQASTQVSGKVTVSAAASDNVGIADVQFLLDGADLGSGMVQSPYSLTWDTSTVKPGTHTLSAIARDAAGNTATAASVTVMTYSVAAPVLRNISVKASSPYAANISWNTDQAASGQVAYGSTTRYGSSSSLSSRMTTAHSVVVSGLKAGDIYHFKIFSRNAAGLITSSTDQRFQMPGGTGSSGQTRSVAPGSVADSPSGGGGAFAWLECVAAFLLLVRRRRKLKA